jgi:hypothetical protein
VIRVEDWAEIWRLHRGQSGCSAGEGLTGGQPVDSRWTDAGEWGSARGSVWSVFVAFATDAAVQGTLGWAGKPEAISESVRHYVRRIEERAQARQREINRKQFATVVGPRSAARSHAGRR